MAVEWIEIGEHRIACGDCTQILPTFDPSTVNAVVTDPPYGIALRNGDVDGHRRKETYSIAGDLDQETGLQVLDWADSLSLPVVYFASPWKPWPGVWRNLIAWDKGGAVGGGGDIKTCLKRTWELIQIRRNGAICGERSESVWRHMLLPSDTVDHICAKPVPLMEALLEKFIPRGATVLDPFMGSGTTGIACIRTGRRFIGIERDPKYFTIARKRLEDELNSTPLFEAKAAVTITQELFI